MTQQQALQEAQRRWGKDGHAWPSKRHCANHCRVGRLDRSRSKLRIIGKGNSWEAAFADADSRQRIHTDNCGRTGKANMVTNCKMDCACWCHADADSKERA